MAARKAREHLGGRCKTPLPRFPHGGLVFVEVHCE